jgi:hypothetical protein
VAEIKKLVILLSFSTYQQADYPLYLPPSYVCKENYIVMKNDRGAKYMALDYVGFYSEYY